MPPVNEGATFGAIRWSIGVHLAPSVYEPVAGVYECLREYRLCFRVACSCENAAINECRASPGFPLKIVFKQEGPSIIVVSAYPVRKERGR
jgi:hypothetical protein